MTMSPTKKWVKPLIDKVTSELYCQTVTTVLNERYGNLRGGPKIIARRIDVTTEAVRDWFFGRTAPRGVELIRLMGACPELEEAIVGLARSSRHTALDEDNRAFHQLSPIEQEQRLRRDLDGLKARLRILNEAENQSMDAMAIGVDRRRPGHGSGAAPEIERRHRA